MFAGSKTPGRYEWRAQTIGSQGQKIETKLPFVVEDLSVENLQPIPDWGLMEQMAKLNRDAGGTLVTPDQVDEIIDLIKERQKWQLKQLSKISVWEMVSWTAGQHS
jgi:hypothetical protein